MKKIFGIILILSINSIDGNASGRVPFVLERTADILGNISSKLVRSRGSLLEGNLPLRAFVHYGLERKFPPQPHIRSFGISSKLSTRLSTTEIPLTAEDSSNSLQHLSIVEFMKAVHENQLITNLVLNVQSPSELSKEFWNTLPFISPNLKKFILYNNFQYEISHLPLPVPFEIFKQYEWPKLTSLCFKLGRIYNGHNNPTQDKILTDIAKSSMPLLQTLRFHDANLTIRGTEALAESTVLPSLRELIFNRCRLEDESAQIIASISRLNQLHLPGNNFTDTGVDCISEMSNLQILDLSNNRIDDIKAFKIARSPFMSNLRELNLEFNSITKIGAEALVKSPYLKVLFELNLSYNQISEKYFNYLCEVAPDYLNIKTSHLQNYENLELKRREKIIKQRQEQRKAEERGDGYDGGTDSSSDEYSEDSNPGPDDGNDGEGDGE